MTDHNLASKPTRRATFGRREALASSLSFALFAAGLGAAVLSSPVGQISDAPLMAATQTVVGTYSNATSKITVKKSVSGTGQSQVTAYIADVTLTDATTLKSAFARGTFATGVVESVTAMAERNNGILAINGDYSGARTAGIVIRNGVAYRNTGTRSGCAVMKDGSFVLYDEAKYNATQLVANNVWQTLSFGPALVQNGKMLTGLDTYEIGDFGAVAAGSIGSIQGNQPRTGIGLIAKNHFVMIVVDGRSPGYSRGVGLTEFAQMFLDAGATMAYNLDGGSSSTMYFNGTEINKPSMGTERATSDILYIAK
jgi:exopolysaccharide biosynthesis protein